ncbi:hypothetical protein RB195_025244 [Necator americanus]|uniref:Uncharacterized protein n=1 Tax=Necator americanus TaxID=51031 RepID=A0ABR1ERJ1_NECAM
MGPCASFYTRLAIKGGIAPSTKGFPQLGQGRPCHSNPRSASLSKLTISKRVKFPLGLRSKLRPRSNQSDVAKSQQVGSNSHYENETA